MSSHPLHSVARCVLRRAKGRGYVVPTEIRDELAQAGQSEDRWKEIIDLLRESLNYRRGRYYHLASANPSQSREDNGQAIVADYVERILEQQNTALAATERREEERQLVVETVHVRLEDGARFSAMSRDLSSKGIRLITNESLLGKKLQVQLPPLAGGHKPLVVLTRIIWTTTTADGLYENGGSFLKPIGAEPMDG